MPIALDMVAAAALDVRQRDAMFELLRANFDGVTRAVFERDLGGKDQVMLLTCTATSRIVGFSTLMRFVLPTPAGEVMVVFSGDTAVEVSARSFWGFGYGLDEYFRRTRAMADARPVHYVLISKGWRTYRVLPFMFRRFVPASSGAQDADLRRVADAFGAARYPERFDRARGVIVAAPGAARVRADGPDAPGTARGGDVHAAFFAAANPGHVRGDELVCVAPADPDNYSEACRRMLARRAAPASPAC